VQVVPTFVCWFLTVSSQDKFIILLLMKKFYLFPTGGKPLPLFSHFIGCCIGLSALFCGPMADAQTTITQWNFNSNPADASTGTGLTTPSTGTGTASTVGSTSTSFASGDANGGSTDPASGDDSGWNITTYATQGTGDKSKGTQFAVSTAGFQNILVKWDQRHSNTAPRHVQLQYTTDGSAWIDFGSPFVGAAGDTWFNNRSADLSSIPAANNNPNFGIRIVATFAPTTSAYAASNTASNYSTTGTWRFDMVTISGTPLCVTPTGTLSNSGPVCPGGAVNLTFNATVNNGPFSIVVNGTTYNNVISGMPFATLTEGVQFSGTTTFTLTQITDANACAANGLNVQTTVTVSSLSNTTITATPNPVAQGGTLNLSVPSAGAGAIYNWAGNGVVNTDANATTAVPTAGGPQTYSVTVTNAGNCISTGTVSVPVTPAVTLSVSTNTGSEASTTAVTVTATASIPVAGNKTVNVAVSGAGITSGDYYLSKTTITILNGQTSGSVTFTVADDGLTEPTETATLTLNSPSSGIVLGNPVSQNVVITDNTCSFLRKTGGFASANGAEIPAFDPVSKRLYTVAGTVVEVLSVSNTGTLSLIGSLPSGLTPPAGTTAIPNSVATNNGILAVSFAIVNSTTNAQQAGRVGFYTAATGAFLNVVMVGALPDMIAFTPDGSKLLSADEGEPNSYGQPNSVDPEGTVSIINLANGVANATVQTAGFTSFNGQAAALRTAGVRIYGPGATVAQDFEPEYVAFSADGQTARIILQENNAIAVLDIASATFTSIQPLGLKNHSLPGNGLDASDQDGPAINIQTRPIFGMYQPDAIARYTVGGQDYYVTANEGDSRSYTGFNEEVRVSAGTYVLDPAAFPNAATLKASSNLGRLQLTNASGDTDGDGDFDRIQAFGARSFSIWNAGGIQIFDSGDQLEQITAAKTPTLFNSDGAAANFDTRSDNKGPEPEGVAIGAINNITYAFVGMERTGDVIVYDVTNPAAPVFVQYLNVPEDRGVEGLIFVSAASSPTGNALLITTAEASLTVSVYEINVPSVSIAVSETSGTTSNDGVICSNSSATLTASGGVSYVWSTNATTPAIAVATAGTYTVTATNANGCTGTATYTLTVNPAPTVAITGTLTFCIGSSTTLTATGSLANYVWSTNATTASISVNTAAVYTVTATNTNNCVSTTSATVVVNPLPTVTCPGNQSVCAGAPAFVLTGGIPSGSTYTGTGVNAGSFDPFAAGVGVHPLTYSYTDGNGCSNSCTFSITVRPQPNGLITATSPVPANSTGNTAAVENAGAGATYSWSITNGTITAGLGGNTITYTAGAAGNVVLDATITNSAVCTTTSSRTIAIGPAPQLNCPPSIVRTTSADGTTGNCAFTGALSHPATSGANTPITLTIAFGNGIPAPGALPTGGIVFAGSSSNYNFDVGKTTVTYTATDNTGNSASCSYTVQVTDNELPSIVCPLSVTKFTDANLCSAVVNYFNPTISDNCTAVVLVRTSGPASGSVFLKGTTMVNWKVTDASGNSAVCGFAVTVKDGQVPAIACPANQAKSTDPSLCSAVVHYATPTATDNCTPAPTLSLQSGQNSGTAFPKGATTVVWRATDAAGLTKTCTFRVTVNDNQAPTITCPANQVRNTDANVCTALTVYPTPTFVDNCPGGSVSILNGLPSNSAFPKGINNVIWRATDAAGLVALCSFTVTVIDNQVPKITCPANLVLTGTITDGVCSAVGVYANPTTTDNCTAASVYLQSGLASYSAFPQGVTTNVWRATDDGGLTATCAFTVTVSCGTGMESEGFEVRTSKFEVRTTDNRQPITMTLAPNPATTEVTISVEGIVPEAGSEISVFDVQGRLVWQRTMEAGVLPAHPFTFSLSDFSSGLYFVTLRSEGAVVTKRLVVNRL